MSYKKILVLFSSQTVAQIIPFLIAPLISRIYGPEMFGTLAILMALTELIGGVSTLRMEMAIPITTSYREALVVTKVCFTFTIIFCLIAFIVLSGLKFFDFLPAISNYIIFIAPFSALILGFGISLNYFNLKNEEYNRIAIANISRSTSQGSFQLFFGYVGGVQFGLILAYLFSGIIYDIRLIKKYLTDVRSSSRIDVDEMKRVIVLYKHFPLFSFWSALLNSMSRNSIIFFLNHLFLKSHVGYYSFALKYINAPLLIIGNSIANVFFEEISKENKNIKQIKILFIKNLKLLLLGSILIFVPVYIYSEMFFPWFFGERWMISGTVVKLMVPLLALRFISNPLSFILLSLRKHKLELILQNIFLIWNVLLWTSIFFFRLNFLESIELLSLGLGIYYFLNIIVLLRIILNLEINN